MDLTNIQIPIPKNWQDFEHLCADLWQEIWNDPDTQMNGRTGQPQHGVDVFGRTNGTGSYQGVQCKGKNGAYGQAVTKKELKDEVEKAKEFEPPIEHFILATTAPNDVAIQEVARELTTAHEKAGLFPVVVYAWDEIERKLGSYPKVLQKHWPGLAYDATKIESDLEEVKASTDSVPEKTIELLLEQLPHLAQPAAESMDAKEEKLNTKIDKHGELIKSEPKTALALLEDLYDSNKTASPQVRYRLLANIGVAFLELNDLEKASAYYIKAGELIPEEARGMSRIALGHLLRNNPAQARIFAEKAISIDPEHAEGYAALIGAISEEEGTEDVEQAIPENMRDNPNVTFNLGQAYLRAGEPAKAVEWSKRAYEVEPDSREGKFAYGEALLSKAYFDLRNNSGEIPQAIIESLETARTHMEEAWKDICDTDNAKRFAYEATNLAHIHQLLSNPKRADEILQRVLELLPELVGARKLAAELCCRKEDPKTALDHLSHIPVGADSQADIMRAETLAEVGRQEDALALLDELEIPSDKRHSLNAVRVLQIRLAEDRQGQSAALELVESELKKDPDNTSILVEKAKLLRDAGELESAKETIAEADKAISESTYPYEVLRIADMMRSLEMFDSAATTFGSVVQFSTDTPALRDYLTCLYNAEQRKTFSEVIERIPEEVLAGGFYKKTIAYHLLQTGELDSARKLFEDYLDTVEDILSVRLAWIQVLQRQMDEETLTSYCSTSPEYPDSSPRDIMRLVHIIMRYGNPDHALKAAYKVSRMNPRDLHALQGYCSLSISGTFPEDIFTPATQVEPDVSFSLESDMGETRDYTIEANWPDQLDGDQILANHPMAREAIGKKAGDTFTTKGMVQETTWTITRIENKYSRWYQGATENIQRYFPVGNTFELVNVRKQGEEEFDFSVIFKSLDQKREAAERAIKSYETSLIPVAAFASSVGADSLDAWIGLRNQTEIICCDGTERERTRALEIIDADHKYIIDPLTLYSLFALGINNEIGKTLKDLAIVQTSLDVFTSKIVDLKNNNRRGYMVSGGDGTYIWDEKKEEDLKKEIEFYDRLLSWTKENCKVIPAIGDIPNVEGWDKIKDMVEPWFFDTMIAANDSGRILFSEDLRYRIYAKTLFQTDGIWIQMALGKAVDNSVIPIKKYSLALGDLIMANHALIGISPHDLIHMLEDADWEESKRFKATVKSLQRESLDARLVILVAAQFIQQLWATHNSHRTKYTNLILSAICQSRQGLMQFILQCIAKVSGYIPVHLRKTYLNTLANWGVGHMIFAPNEFEAFLNKQ